MQDYKIAVKEQFGNETDFVGKSLHKPKQEAKNMKVTAIISDKRKGGYHEKWRGPIGTPKEKQEACVFALQNMTNGSIRFHAETLPDDLKARQAFRIIRKTGNFPPIDCERRRGYYLLSFEV